MSVALLDVNVLIALADNSHIHHSLAHNWFSGQENRPFATCPITQNGFLRIVGHPRYPGGPGTPRALLDFMDSLCQLKGHVFWVDSISITDGLLFPRNIFGASANLTDIYLLGLAVSHQGRFATFDRKISVRSVLGADKAIELIHA